MALAATTDSVMAQKPLLLKDYLEMDPNSDSYNSFTSFPRNPHSTITVRFLLEADHCRVTATADSGGPTTLTRFRSKSGRAAFTKLSAAINNAVKNFPLSSQKLGKKFWRKKEKEGEHKVRVKDIVRLDSFELRGETRKSLYFPSPVVSSCSSCFDGDDQRSESFLSLSSSTGNSVNSSSPRRTRDCPRSPAVSLSAPFSVFYH